MTAEFVTSSHHYHPMLFTQAQKGLALTSLTKNTTRYYIFLRSTPIFCVSHCNQHFDCVHDQFNCSLNECQEILQL